MSKGPILQKTWDNLSEARKKRIIKRAAELESEYLSLQEVRKEAGLSQASVSKKLHMDQGNISRIERNSDMLLSTLQGYIEAIGGKLKLTVKLPNKPAIVLTGLGDLIESSNSKK